MSASAFHVTRTSTGIRVWFSVLNANRTLRTGLTAGNFTVTLINDADSATNNPAVSESTQLSGVYFFDVPSGFLTTNGNNYCVVIQVTLAPVDVISAPLFVTQRLWDQLAQPGDAMDLIAGAVDAAAIATDAIDVDAIAAGAITSVEAPALANLDATVSSRSSHSAADVDTTLTGTHGAGAWTTATGFSTHSAADVDTVLTAAHGAGSWATATGFAVPADAMALTGAAETSLLGVFDAAHGVGSWVGAGLTVAQDARLTYLHIHAGGVNGNKMNHTRAVIGTPGRAFSDDATVDQTVTQVDANTATFEQVP